MREIIERNHKEAYEKYQAEWRKEQKKEKILTGIVAAFIVVLTVAVISFCDYQTSGAVDNCMAKGYSRNYCVERLG